MPTEEFFVERNGCPFCHQSDHPILCTINYHDTAEANRELPNISGKLYHCFDCGVAYPSHMYRVEAFPKLYQKTFNDLKYFDDSFMQVIRKKYLKEVLRNHHRSPSLSRLLDFLSLYVFQVPRITRKPQGLQILDVGCGFGEFLDIYKDLGNDVVGTEIHPALVERLANRGLDCRLGELENIDFQNAKFDIIILRAVFYRTRSPNNTLQLLKHLLAPDGQIAILDPCPKVDGVEYYFKKQFPQGQFYIVHQAKYMKMFREKFDLACSDSKLIYGRPNAPLKPIKLLGNVMGLLELLSANLFKYNPYVLSYNLKIET